MRLLKIIAFWMSAIFPFLLLYPLSKMYGGYWLIIALLFYAMLYRPMIHIVRLLDLGKIQSKDAIKFFIPFYSAKFTKSLWLG